MPQTSAPKVSTEVVNLEPLSQDLIWSCFVELELDCPRDTRGQLTHTRVGDVSVVNTEQRSSGLRLSRQSHLISNSCFDDLYACVLLSGRMDIDLGGNISSLRANDIIMLDTTRPYTINIYPDSSELWVRFPRHWLESHLPDVNAIIGPVIGRTPGLAAIGHDTLVSCGRAAPSLLETQAQQFLMMVNNAVGVLTDAHFDMENSALTRSSKNTLLRIKRYVEQNLEDEGLSLSGVAAELQISPRYLARLFHASGTTFSRWLNQRRLELCRQLLLDRRQADRSIQDIAYSCGFANVPNFNRLFRSAVGLTPSEFRRTRLS